jgi:hypothetical protein
VSRQAIPTERALHLIDLENLIGDPWATGPGVAETYERALAAAGHAPGDLVVVAANRWLLAELGFVAHTSCQMLVAHGRDGADLALLGWGNPEWIAGRFARLVVASGDGIFGDAVARAHALGVRVDVVHGGGALSKRLRRPDTGVVRIVVPAKCRRPHRRAARVKGARA